MHYTVQDAEGIYQAETFDRAIELMTAQDSSAVILREGQAILLQDDLLNHTDFGMNDAERETWGRVSA